MDFDFSIFDNTDAKAATEAKELAEAKFIVAGQGRDWEEIIVNMCRGCGYNEIKMISMIAAYRTQGAIPRECVAGVVSRSSSPRRTEWEMRGSRNGE